MIELTILGGVDLRRDDGAPIGSVLNQPRRLALLVYLAVESVDGGVQRDRLLGVFWPDLSQDQARQALRSALHYLRRSLGRDAIVGEGGALRVDPAVVTCDAASFLEALRRDEHEAALRAYRGDLLPGFYLDDGPAGFERWVDETRASLRRSAAEAAWAMAADREAAGNAPAAGAWARRASELSGADEPAVRRAMELLARIGDRAGALVAYDDLVRRLRQDLDASPSAETRALAEGVKRREAGGDEPEVAPAQTVVAAQSPMPGSPDRGVRRRTRWLAASKRGLRAAYSMAVTAVLVLGFYSLWGLNRGGPPPAAASPGATVLRIEEIRDFTGDRAASDLAGALTLELVGRLNDVEAIRVVAPVASDRPETEAAGYVVRGGLLRTDSVVRLTAMLLDGESGATLDHITTEHVVGGTTAATHEIAEALARRVRREIGRSVEARERTAGARNPRALDLVRSALRDMEAGDSLRDAGARDAAAAAFTGADAQLALAQSAAPGWSEPSIRRAELAYRTMWLHMLSADPAGSTAALAEGLAHADAAIGIAPRDPAAHELRGLLGYWTWRLSEPADPATLRQAEAHLQRATDLDRGRGRAWSLLAAIHQARGDFAGANLAARRAHQADPYLENGLETVVRLFTTSLEVGDVAGARRWCDELGRRSPGSWLPRYCALEQLAWDPPPDLDAESVHRLIRGPSGAAALPDQMLVDLEMIGAVVLARTDLPGAKELVEQARGRVAAPTSRQVSLEAWARLAMGEAEAAVDLLREAATSNPRLAQSVLQSRRFQPLRASGALQSLLAAN